MSKCNGRYFLREDFKFTNHGYRYEKYEYIEVLFLQNRKIQIKFEGTRNTTVITKEEFDQIPLSSADSINEFLWGISNGNK